MNNVDHDIDVTTYPWIHAKRADRQVMNLNHDIYYNYLINRLKILHNIRSPYEFGNW